MARPHPALIEIAAGRPPPSRVDDPERLLASAVDHRMQGLLRSAVLKEQIVLPSRAELELAALDLLTQSHHRRLWKLLHGVVGRLAKLDIEVAALKGVTAEARWYERRGERPSWDLDLWLCPHQSDRIDEVVDVLHPGHPLAGHVGEYTRRGYLQSVDLVVDGIDVDLHFDPIKLGIPFQQAPFLWDTTEYLYDVRVLSDAGSALLSGIHLLKDGFSQLGPVHEFVKLQHIAPPGPLWGLAWDEGIDSWMAFAVETVESELQVETNVPVALPRLIRRLGILAYRPSTRLLGKERLIEGVRTWYIVTLTASGRLRHVSRWLHSKFNIPPDLAAHNLSLLRGSGVLAAIRAMQLSRSARRDPK